MMKSLNVKILAVLLVVIILFGGATYLLKGKNKTNTQTTKATPSAVPTQVPGAQSTTNGTLLDILALGKTEQCTFSYTSKDGGKSEGTFYVSGTKSRGDFKMTSAANKVTQMSMIRDGETSYIWGSAFPEGGIKMTISLDKLKTDAQASKYFDANQKVDYKCSSWTLSGAQFTPPANVKFTDLSSLMQGLLPKASANAAGGSPSPTDTSSQCAVCNNLTGAAKTTCLTQLNCQ